MTEETKTQEATPVAQETVVTKEEVAEIKETITKVEEETVATAKAEGVVEGKTIAELQAELKASQDENARIAAIQEEAKQRADLEAQIAAEKAKAEAPVKKQLVPTSTNPVTQPQVENSTEIKLSKEQEWDAFEQSARGGASATIPLE